MKTPRVMTEDEAIKRFECSLADACGNDRDGCIDICGYLFDPASALKQLDPIAYRCGFLDWLIAENIQIEDEE